MTEYGHTVWLHPGAHDLGINDGAAFDPGGLLDDERLTRGPVGAIYRIEPHAPVADMDLQPVSVVL